MFLALVRDLEGLAVVANASVAIAKGLHPLDLVFEIAATAVVSLDMEVCQLEGAVIILAPLLRLDVVLVAVIVLPISRSVAAVSLIRVPELTLVLMCFYFPQ